MSNISKYANLPGIALDQPDIFETSDLPEVDQLRSLHVTPSSASTQSSTINLQTYNQLNNDNNTSLNINIIKTSANDAYNIFKDKLLKSSNETNFDYLSNLNLKQVGYQSFGEFELNDESTRSEETPLQRYKRLQYEVNDLMNSLNKKSNSDKERSGDENKVQPSFGGELNKTDLLESLNGMDEQLKNLNIESYGDFNLFTAINKIDDFNSMIANLDDIKQTTETKDKATKSDSLITYELNCNPQFIQIRDQTKLNSFEHRIKRIENIVGNENDKISFLTSLTNDKCLTKSVDFLSEKISQLDQTHLELLDTRLKSLLTKLNQLSEKKPILDDLEKRSKIDELYSIVIENEKNSNALPMIANRLNVLNDLHEQAIQFSSALSYIDSLQTQINETMSANEKDLNELKINLNKNIIDIKDVMNSFNERLDKLSK